MGLAQSFVGAQKELQETMQKKVLARQVQQGERMRRLQLTMQMAIMREQLNWIAGVYTVGVTGLTLRTIQTKSFPPLAAIPLVVVGTYIAYLWDFAYGTKLDRINKIHHEILREQRFCNPLLLSFDEMKKDEELFGGIDLEEVD